MTRTLGHSGIEVSATGLGCNNFGRNGTATEDLAGTRRVIDAAIDHGITLFDTADIYGDPATASETLMGQALGSKRDEIVLATKWGHSGVPVEGTQTWGAKGARGYIERAVEASLSRLQTDRIDLFQLHTPDSSTPIEETVQVLDELVVAGKIRAYGHSNFSAQQIREAAAVQTPNGFATAQNEYSLLSRGIEQEVLPAALDAGLGLLPYFPLANGLLTGKYSRDDRPAGARLTALKPALLEGVDWDAIERYRAAAEGWGITMLEATFGWLLAQRPVTSVIAGATSTEQIAANAAAGETALTAEQVETISAVFAGQ